MAFGTLLLTHSTNFSCADVTTAHVQRKGGGRWCVVCRHVMLRALARAAGLACVSPAGSCLPQGGPHFCPADATKAIVPMVPSWAPGSVQGLVLRLLACLMAEAIAALSFSFPPLRMRMRQRSPGEGTQLTSQERSQPFACRECSGRAVPA